MHVEGGGGGGGGGGGLHKNFPSRCDSSKKHSLNNKPCLTDLGHRDKAGTSQLCTVYAGPLLVSFLTQPFKTGSMRMQAMQFRTHSSGAFE